MNGKQLKYVRHASTGFVVWPAKYPGLTHREVARAIRSGENVKRGETLSAGFVEWDFDGRPFCCGRSESLDIASREDDTAALRAEWGMPAAAEDLSKVLADFEACVSPITPAMRADAAAIGACCDPLSLESGEPA